jgi:predicted transcriptional regulator
LHPESFGNTILCGGNTFGFAIMTAFTVKVPDDLHDELERFLRATGKSRSAFVRELIERELRSQAQQQAELRARVMALAGSAGGGSASPRTDNASNVKRILLDEGYGT